MSEIQVRMCELAVGGQRDTLRATLGSCVGIGLLWRERAVYGLAHCLLPGDPATARAEGARYVTQAIPLLLSRMRARQADHAALEAVLAGGANMMTHRSPAPQHASIGAQNVRMAQSLLDSFGVRLVHMDVGGACGRQLLIDGARHAYLIKTIARPH